MNESSDTAATGERTRSPMPTLRGIDDKQASRRAAEVLDEVSWHGAEINPDAITAADFLSLL